MNATHTSGKQIAACRPRITPLKGSPPDCIRSADNRLVNAEGYRITPLWLPYTSDKSFASKATAIRVLMGRVPLLLDCSL